MYLSIYLSPIICLVYLSIIYLDIPLVLFLWRALTDRGCFLFGTPGRSIILSPLWRWRWWSPPGRSWFWDQKAWLTHASPFPGNLQPPDLVHPGMKHSFFAEVEGLPSWWTWAHWSFAALPLGYLGRTRCFLPNKPPHWKYTDVSANSVFRIAFSFICLSPFLAIFRPLMSQKLLMAFIYPQMWSKNLKQLVYRQAYQREDIHTGLYIFLLMVW